MCKSCNFTSQTNLFSEIPLFIDKNIFLHVLLEDEKEKQKNSNKPIYFTNKSKKTFIELLETGMKYKIILPGNSFDRQFYNEERGIILGNLINRYRSGENSISMLKLKKEFPNLNTQFENELKKLVNFHWPTKKKNKFNEYLQDPEIMLAIYWFNIKNIFTLDIKCFKVIAKNYQQFMQSNHQFNLFFDLNKSRNIDFDFIKEIHK